MASEPSGNEITVRVLTISDRSHSGEREDRSGPVAAAALESAGFRVAGVTVSPDGRAEVEAAVAAALEEGVDLILTLGGTGVGPRDQTPEGTRPMLDTELPGIAEGLRAAGAQKVPTAVLSRGLAGVGRHSESAKRAVIVNLPGSTGGAEDGVAYLAPIIPHLIDQLRGGDH